MNQQFGHHPPAYGAESGSLEPRLSTGKYEFQPWDAQRVTAMASQTKKWGLVATVSGVISLLGSMGVGVMALVVTQGPIMFGILGVAAAWFFGSLGNAVLGHLFVKAGKELDLVEASQGDDVEALMQGLAKLSHAFRLEVFVGGGAALFSLLLTIVFKFLA
jgi:hypothetical protein